MGDYNSIKDRFIPFSLYVWLGTCDLTHKQVKYISLKDSYNRDAAKLILNYKKLAKQASELNFSATFLEIPYYSIVEWNKAKGHKNPDVFQEQDKKLQLAIQVINEEIRKINIENDTRSPKFNVDLERNRKK